MAEHKHRILIDQAVLKIETALETALEELADGIDAAVRQEVADSVVQFVTRAAPIERGAVRDVGASAQRIASGERKRAPWGATRSAIVSTFTGLLSPGVGATLDDFAETARRQGNEVAPSSIRSMALDMEKAGEMRRENGRWFPIRIEIEKGGAAISGEDPTAAPSTSQDAAYAGPVSAG